MRGHLAGVAEEPRESPRLDLVARLIPRDLDPLPKIRASFSQEDDGLGGFDLRKEEPVLPSIPAPVSQEVAGRSGNARPALLSPLLDPLADQVHALELDVEAAALVLVPAGLELVVHGRPPSGAPIACLAFDDPPVFLWLFEGRAQDWGWDFEGAHSPNAC
jgi:hypothetical protein